jgi:hypothetical protein
MKRKSAFTAPQTVPPSGDEKKAGETEESTEAASVAI